MICSTGERGFSSRNRRILDSTIGSSVVTICDEDSRLFAGTAVFARNSIRPGADGLIEGGPRPQGFACPHRYAHALRARQSDAGGRSVAGAVQAGLGLRLRGQTGRHGSFCAEVPDTLALEGRGRKAEGEDDYEVISDQYSVRGTRMEEAEAEAEAEEGMSWRPWRTG
jgi:hypothetical protein